MSNFKRPGIENENEQGVMYDEEYFPIRKYNAFEIRDGSLLCFSVRSKFRWIPCCRERFHRGFAF